MLITRGTDHSSILIVATVVYPPSSKVTLVQACLISGTSNIVHPDLSSSTAKVSITVSMYSATGEP